jgi:hypothetical protein
MSWLHKILDDAPEPDPDKYTPIACEACEGTGWLMSGGRMYAIKGMPTACTSCGSAGMGHEA